MVFFMIFVLATSLLLGNALSANSAVVNLGYAQYYGNEPGTGVKEFLGMVYAGPPIGNLKWRAPQSPLKSRNLQNATVVSERPELATHGRWTTG